MAKKYRIEVSKDETPAIFESLVKATNYLGNKYRTRRIPELLDLFKSEFGVTISRDKITPQGWTRYWVTWNTVEGFTVFMLRWS